MTVRVLPDVAGLDKEFDYRLPAPVAAEHAGTVSPDPAAADLWEALVGAMVRVPLHGRRVVGWIVAVDPPAAVSDERLHDVAGFVSHGPAPELVELAGWASVRWAAGRRRPFLGTASPPRRVRRLPLRVRQSIASTPGDQRRRPSNDEVVTAIAALPPAGGVVALAPTTSPLAAIAELAAHGSTLVVMPSVARAAAMAAALRRRGLDVALLPDDWSHAAIGADVVIGARAAAWGPCPGLRAAVVVDEHDEAMQEERSPTWHARDVVVERARRAGAPVVLTSPAPTVSGLAATGAALADVGAGARRAGWPLVEIVDRGDDEPWKSSLVTSALIGYLRRPELTVVCVHNIPGRSRVLACRSCRELARCTRCQAAVALDADARFVCARCGEDRPPVCAVCGSTAFANLKPGVTRLREELEAAAGRPVVAVTGADAATDATQDGPAVYVGTEAVLHRVRRADVVAYLDIDRELLAPRYRAGEQALALLVRGARLVGRRADGGRLLVQTYLPDHEVIQAALRADPERLLAVEAERRQLFGFPPARALAAVSGAGSAELVDELRRRAGASGLVVGGGDDRYLVTAPDWIVLGTELLAAKAAAGTRPRIEVDPPRA